ncbi:hypothetical protein [Parvibaculum lavamentivorans]|nr:hypothetical protein [Parvibaculum lavamentivorans]
MIEPEARIFTQTASSPRQKDTTLAIAAEATAKYFWDNADQSFVFTPFARLDQHDNRRTHWDIREARYALYSGKWELRVGFDKVFWGVTEAVHLVDVVNQTDLLEDPVKQEVKLGQPMLRLRTAQEFGTFDVFLLPYFRERTFPGADGRPATDIPVDTNLTTYESSAEEWHTDFAGRYSNTLGPFDIGLGYFQGTARDPILQPAFDGAGNLVLAPFYPQMKQASLDLQATIGAWLYKFEGFGRRELGDNYAAATGGIEYTFYGAFGSDGDLGTVVEYSYDSRGMNQRNPYQNDAFLALRWSANDTASTSMLGGIAVDTETGALGFRLRGERRLAEDYRLSIEAYVFGNVPTRDPVYHIADDDYVQIRIARFF